MTRAPLSLPQARSFAQTSRRDSWWLFPAITLIYFLSFIVYSTWAAWQGNHYFYDGGGAQYLSPMYSPVLFFRMILMMSQMAIGIAGPR